MKKLILIIAGLFLLAPAKATDDRHLDAWYATYNHEYFQDELPKNVVITRNLTDDGFSAVTFYTSSWFHIAINPRLNVDPAAEKMTLLHEMCHIDIVVIKDDNELDKHGLKWQACMHRLANENAFEELW